MSTGSEVTAAKPSSWRAQAVKLVAIVAAVFIVKGALAEPFYVPSGSMEPTLLIGDHIMVNKIRYGLRMPDSLFGLNPLANEIPYGHYLIHFAPVRRGADQLRGPCPIHRSASAESRSFSVNIRKNAFRCFTCGATGNQLDLWSKVHGLTLFDAAVDLCDRLHLAVPWLATTPGSSSPSRTEKRNP